MSDNLLTRLNRIASEILPGHEIETIARGEGYYVFEIYRVHRGRDLRFRPFGSIPTPMTTRLRTN